MMPSRPIVMSALLIALVGCASALPESTRREGGSPDPSAVSTVAVEPPADAARIVCDHDAVRLNTTLVRAHTDGVRVVINNPGGAWGFEFHPASYEHGQAMGGDLGEGVTEQTWTIPPGEVTVACLPDARSSYFDPEAATAILTVVDPGGLYVRWDMACGFGEQFRIRVEAAEDEDPADVFRRVPGVLPSDELRKPGYPQSPLHWPTFNVFREGEAVARIAAPRIGKEWELLVNACPGSGVEKS